MQYLIIEKTGEAFFSNWFDVENHLTEGRRVFDLVNALEYNIGEDGFPEVTTIEEDHL